MIDKETFRSVFADFDPEIINQIANLYIAEHPVKFTELNDSLARNDLKAISNLAHGLKGVLSQFFAYEAQMSAKELEVFSRELSEQYGDKSGASILPEHSERLRKMIDKLFEYSLLVIADLKEIRLQYANNA